MCKSCTKYKFILSTKRRLERLSSAFKIVKFVELYLQKSSPFGGFNVKADARMRKLTGLTNERHSRLYLLYNTHISPRRSLNIYSQSYNMDTAYAISVMFMPQLPPLPSTLPPHS